MYKKRGRSTVLILSLVILAVAGCADATSSNQTESSRIAPDFTLQSPTGEDVTLSQFQGKKNVLLVFGATWCPHCVGEIPELKEIYGKYKDGDLKLLSIDVKESAKKLQSFAQKHAIPYTILLDLTGEVAKSYGVRGIPHQVIIDKEGRIFYEGPRPGGGLMPLLLKLME